MRTGKMLLPLAVIAVSAGILTAGFAVSDNETSVTAGTIKNISVTVEEGNSGTVYFDIEPTEAGSPSSFKFGANNTAAVQILTAARVAKAQVRITHRADFTVTEIEF